MRKWVGGVGGGFRCLDWWDWIGVWGLMDGAMGYESGLWGVFSSI